MVSLRSLLATASVAVVAVAQTPKIAFSSIPSVAIAGQSYNITWGGGDDSPVTLSLRKGNPNDLATIGVIADRLQGYWYLWNVSTLLATGDDYALQIVQGQSDINYSGLFSIVGGTGNVSISYSGYTTTTGMANSTTSTATITSGYSMGTGSALPRNTTFMTPSITATASTTKKPASTSSTSTTSSQNAAATMGSSAAFAMGLIGAIMFLQ